MYFPTQIELIAHSFPDTVCLKVDILTRFGGRTERLLLAANYIRSNQMRDSLNWNNMCRPGPKQQPQNVQMKQMNSSGKQWAKIVKIISVSLTRAIYWLVPSIARGKMSNNGFSGLTLRVRHMRRLTSDDNYQNAIPCSIENSNSIEWCGRCYLHKRLICSIDMEHSWNFRKPYIGLRFHNASGAHSYATH